MSALDKYFVDLAERCKALDQANRAAIEVLNSAECTEGNCGWNGKRSDCERVCEALECPNCKRLISW